MSSFASKVAGAAFSAFIRSKFGRDIAPCNPSLDRFSLLVAFGRCRFRLEISFIASALSSILGCPADALNVELLEDRIFLFSVSCKLLGLEIYNIRRFSCDEFELSFHLLNDKGLDAARLLASDKPRPFPWVEVGKKPSYADMAKSQMRVQKGVLTEANAIPIGSQMGVLSGANATPLGQQAGVLSEANAVPLRAPVHVTHLAESRVVHRAGYGFHPFRAEQMSSRKSVFQRILFPKRQSLSQQKWVRKRPVSQSGTSVILDDCSVQQIVQPSVHQQTPSSPNSNLDLNLHLGRQSFGHEKLPINEPPNGRALTVVRCRRCLSSTHARHECRFQIKCNVCFEWGHVAASCQMQ